MSSASNYDAPPQVGSGGFEIDRPTKRFPNIPDLIHDESNAHLLSSLLPALDKYKCLDPPFKRKRSPWVRAYCDLYHPSGPWGSSKFLNAPDIEKKTKYSFKGYKMQSIYRNLQSYTGDNAIHKELYKRLQDFYETKEKYFSSFMKSCEEIAYLELAKDAKDRAPIPGSIVELQVIMANRATDVADNGNRTLEQGPTTNTVDEPAPKRQRLDDSNDNGIVVLTDENHNAVDNSIENTNNRIEANESNIVASNRVSTDDALVEIAVATENSNTEDDRSDGITDKEDISKSKDSSNNDSKEEDGDNNEDQEFDTQFQTHGNQEIDNSKQAEEDEEPSISVPKGSKVNGNAGDVTNPSSNATGVNEKSRTDVVVTPSKGDACANSTSNQGITSDNNQQDKESEIPLLEKKREDLFKLLTKRRAYLGNDGQDDNICAKMMKAIDNIDNTLVDALLNI
ncbi:hypothetical protein CTEN210_18424 [Chaetoceros tenuissimus]|uniref:Uncharacterized protein n=1 Tax=Chaetoceros tenuissimus TaxID=426638 RepID=A0AAD3DCM3_9STRA|nr:hypothetical protein CTEN210_18424 [Chaetoceros tenuissimus]